MANINQDYNGQTRLKNWWKIIKQNLHLMNDQIEKHVSGEADRHSAEDIDYNGTISGQTNVKGAVEQVQSNLGAHTSNRSNPHNVTKAQVGLGNVDNTSDEDKPISTATQEALDGKVDKENGKGLSTEDYTTAEKNKLAGIEEGANNYTHPSSHPASMITQSSTYRFVSDIEKAAWNGKLDAENIIAGDNVTVTTSGNNVTISSVGGGGSGSDITVVDSLTSTSTTNALSANQGRVLKSAVDGKAATSHASASTTYGVGTASNYGHVKLANNLTTTATGSALDARQGKTLQDSKLEASNIIAGDNIDLSVSGKNVTISAGGGLLPRLDIIAATGTTVTVTDGTTTLSKTSIGFTESTSIGEASFDIPNFGTWTVTAGSYNKVVDIDTVKVYTFTGLSLKNATWTQIGEISEAGRAQDIWSIGDEKDITAGSETLTLVIVDFEHDYKSDGSGRAGITFGLKDLMATTRRMNAGSTNANGFTGSEMYTWLQGDLLSSLPSDLRTTIKFVDKRTSAGNQSAAININEMKIFLFAEIELFGTVSISADGEGKQYPYFATNADRIKRLSNGTGSAESWWLRSPCARVSSSFCSASSTGAITSFSSQYAKGVCFGFCV